MQHLPLLSGAGPSHTLQPALIFGGQNQRLPLRFEWHKPFLHGNVVIVEGINENANLSARTTLMYRPAPGSPALPKDNCTNVLFGVTLGLLGGCALRKRTDPGGCLATGCVRVWSSGWRFECPVQRVRMPANVVASLAIQPE